MATARDIIKRSLRLIGVLAAGESATAEEAQDGLEALNAMLDSWSLDRLVVFGRTTVTKTLTIGDGDYSLGTGGDIATERPDKITEVYITLNGVDYPLSQLSERSYIEIPDKSTQGLPNQYYVNDTSTLSTLYLYPVPDQAYTLNLSKTEPLQSFTNLSDTITLPSGFEDAMAYNLAVRLAPEYGKEPSMTVMRTANSSLAAVKRANYKPMRQKTEIGYIRQTSSGFNINRGY